MADSDYDSSEDEDYVPEAGVGDIEDEPSGDEVDEVTGEGELVTGKRIKTKDTKKQLVQEKVIPKPSAAAEIDADALFAAMLEDEDPILSRYKTEPKKDETDVSSIEKTDSASPKDNEEPCSSSSHVAKGVENAPTISDGSNTTVITEVFDFAGDEVKVQREVTMDELREKEEKDRKRAEEGPRKQPQKRMGLGGALTLLAKKTKMSVLDKSNHDWKAFKDEHKIEEELSTFNKGKDGYLTKMDFLTRTDHRQFENEKAMRNSQRKTK